MAANPLFLYAIMGKHTFLAFDCGATSGRAVLATFDGGTFSMEEVYRFPSGIIELHGKYYWDIFAIYEHFVKCLDSLEHKGIRPCSIGIDTWGVDFGFAGEDGTVLSNPRSYRDPYTAGVPEKVFLEIPREELYAATGIQILNFNSVFQLCAQKAEGFSPLKAAKHLLFVPDLLAYMLTGNKVCEYTIASTSGMMDQQARQFDKALLERLGLRTDILLPIVQPGTEVGRYKGIPVIAVAGHDTASAIAAVPAEDENFAYLSSGTWSLMGIEAPAPIINAESALLNFTNEGGIDGTTRFLKNITGMWLLEQCRKVWKAEGKDYGYAQLMEMAAAETDFPGRIDPDDQRFANPADMVEEIKSAVGGDMSDAQIVSCIYHSLVDTYRKVLGMLRSFAPFPIERLHVIGGGSANELLNQWTADALGIPVIAGPTEATAIGNVMMQARAAGLVKDRWEMRGIVARSFDLKLFTPSTKTL